MSTALAALPPLDPDVMKEADADERRRIVMTRMLLARPQRPATARMLRNELIETEERIAKRARK